MIKTRKMSHGWVGGHKSAKNVTYFLNPQFVNSRFQDIYDLWLHLDMKIKEKFSTVEAA
jgi:hypothetical protein